MTSLVADYDSGPDLASDSDDSSPETKSEAMGVVIKLPKPSFDQKDGRLDAETSVFTNSYQLAENAKLQALERHVKMTSRPDATSGNKVCWNHRKGRCRFGHNCRFAHDTDLMTLNNVNQVGEQQHNARQGARPHHHQPHRSQLPPHEEEEKVASRVKRRPGLARDLVPSKAVLKAFGKQQKRERPWTVGGKPP